MNSMVCWIERPAPGFWESAKHREHAPGLSTQNEAPGGRAGYDLPRLLLRRYGSEGTLRAQGLRGDVVLETAAGSVEVTDISDAHLHVKTLSGPITLTDIRNSHLEIHSVRGNVNLHNVTGPSVEVNSGSGRITYDGDPGRVGEYRLISHTGVLEVSIPSSAWVEIKARSIRSQSDPEFPSVNSAPPLGQTSLLGGPGKTLGPRFDLHSFSGKIRIKRP